MKRYVVWYRENGKSRKYGSTTSQDEAKRMVCELTYSFPFECVFNSSHGGGKNLGYKSSCSAWYTIHNT